MKKISKVRRVSEGHFTVKTVRPGFIHIEETKDETEWKVEDIFGISSSCLGDTELEATWMGQIKLDKRRRIWNNHEVRITLESRPKKGHDMKNTPPNCN